MDDAVLRHNATVEERHWWFAARRSILTELVRELAGAKRLGVVDIGCGTGGNAGALSAEHDVLGLDASAEAVRLARERHPKARFERVTELGAVRAAAFGADLVLLMDVIEHVEDDFELLSTVVSALQPGAHLLVTVPADPQLWSAHDVASRHWRRYTAERLRRVWRGLPVEEPLYSHCNALLAPLVRTARALRRGREPLHGTGADLALPAAPINAFLRWTFARERARLVRALRGQPAAAYGDGVSLIAILRRTPGECAPRTKPSDVPRDEHRPAS